jgi:hypothetical protein
MALQQIPSFNMDAYASPWETVSTSEKPGVPTYLELAKSFLPLVGSTPLKELFPDQTIKQPIVAIEQRFETSGTLLPPVKFGEPDQLLGVSQYTTQRRYIQPLYLRGSHYISWGDVNIRIKDGTLNDFEDPQAYVTKQVEKLVETHNLTWDVYRGLTLLGGINYTDPRSGQPVSVSAQIPAHNFWSYNNVNGYRGRNEANLFRGLIDYNTPQASTAGVPWTDPDAAIVSCIQKFVYWFKTTNKTRVTAMYIHPDLKQIISENNEIKLQTGGLIPRFGAQTGDKQVMINNTGGGYQIGANELAANAFGSIGVGPEGIISIAGVPIRTVETWYRDPVDGVRKYLWPRNKVVFVSEVNPDGTYEAPGRTQYCVSEESGGEPGLWMREQRDTPIPAAPGMYLQLGNAGLPYLLYPHRVAHMTVGTIQDINTRIGILGDLGYGSI